MGINVEKIELRRNKLGLTMDQAARAMGWSSRTKWYDFLHREGDVQLGTLLKLADVLRCSVADLIDEAWPPSRRREK